MKIIEAQEILYNALSFSITTEQKEALKLLTLYAEKAEKAEERKKQNAKPKTEKFIDKILAINAKTEKKYGDYPQIIFKASDGKCCVNMLGYMAVEFPGEYAEGYNIINEGENGYINMRKYVKAAEDTKAETPLILPLEAEIKAMAKDKSVKGYNFGEGLPFVDCKYLLMIISHFPDAVLYPTKYYAAADEYAHIYFETPNGVKGVLMCIIIDGR